MFERFTDRARRLVVLAQDEARKNYNHNYIGTEHLLLGLIAEGEGVAAKVLEILGISLDALRQQVEELIGWGPTTPEGHIPFTPSAKKALELSLREAVQNGHNYIGTEHLLLGMIREEKGVAALVLVGRGATLEVVRQRAIQLLAGYQGNGPEIVSATALPALAAEPAQAPESPDGPFERYTDRSERVVGLSLEEARMLQHSYLGTEHLLLGMLREGEGVAAEALVAQGITLGDVRHAVAEIIGLGRQAPSPHIPFTPRAKKVLELASREAQQLGHRFIGTEHLLLGLVREGEGVAAQILVRLGSNLLQLRQQVIDLLNGTSQVSVVAAAPVLLPAVVPARTGRSSAVLDQFGRNLTLAALEGTLDPVIGREREIQKILQILMLRTRNNPLVIGAPGIGKRSVVEGLVQAISRSDAPRWFQGKLVQTLDPDLLAGSPYDRTSLGARLASLSEEIRSAGNTILVIDGTLAPTNRTLSSTDTMSLLKPLLARGEVQVIGTATAAEYQRLLEGDPSLERFFQPIRIEEPSLADTIDILKAVRLRYETHHEVSIPDAALERVAELADRYIRDRPAPGKTVDLLDQASAFARMLMAAAPAEPGEVPQVTEKDVIEALAATLGVEGSELSERIGRQRKPRRREVSLTEDDRAIWAMS